MDNLERLIKREGEVVGNLSLVLRSRTVLRGDQDDTVCTPVTVDCTGGCILQHVDGGDIGRVDIAETLLHTVHENERTG